MNISALAILPSIKGIDEKIIKTRTEYRERDFDKNF